MESTILFFIIMLVMATSTHAADPFDMMVNCQLTHSMEQCRVDLEEMCGPDMSSARTVLALTRVYNNECHDTIARAAYAAYDHVQFNNPSSHLYEFDLFAANLPEFKKIVRAEKAGPAIVQSGANGVNAQILHRVKNPVYDRFEWTSGTAFAG